jgi:hypothetical protein
MCVGVSLKESENPTHVAYKTGCYYTLQVYVRQQKKPYCICILCRFDVLPEDEPRGVEKM